MKRKLSELIEIAKLSNSQLSIDLKDVSDKHFSKPQATFTKVKVWSGSNTAPKKKVAPQANVAEVEEVAPEVVEDAKVFNPDERYEDIIEMTNQEVLHFYGDTGVIRQRMIDMNIPFNKTIKKSDKLIDIFREAIKEA